MTDYSLPYQDAGGCLCALPFITASLASYSLSLLCLVLPPPRIPRPCPSTMPESRPDRLAIHCHGNRYLDGYALLGQGQVRKFPSLPPPPLARPSSLCTSPAPCMPGPTLRLSKIGATSLFCIENPALLSTGARDRAAGLLWDAVTVPDSICVYSRSAHRISTCNPDVHLQPSIESVFYDHATTPSMPRATTDIF
jgi:hypothetical protein